MHAYQTLSLPWCQLMFCANESIWYAVGCSLCPYYNMAAISKSAKAGSLRFSHDCGTVASLYRDAYNEGIGVGEANRHHIRTTSFTVFVLFSGSVSAFSGPCPLLRLYFERSSFSFVLFFFFFLFSHTFLLLLSKETTAVGLLACLLA